MRTINDPKKVAELISASFEPNQVSIDYLSDGSISVVCPHLPSWVFSKVSNSVIRIGVYPAGNEVSVNIYKL